jgi:ribosome biogenesis GTPase A
LAQSWYPGHMAKATTELAASLKLIDVVIEVVDSRAPAATSNPTLAAVAGRVPRVVVLNKVDLADPKTTDAWKSSLRRLGCAAVTANSQTGAGIAAVIDAAVESARRSGRGGGVSRGARRRFRSAVVGIPNVGKSSFINRVSRRGGAKVGDKPGVTRANQWIVASPELELLDTPGIMPTRVDEPLTWTLLCALGCVDDNLFDAEEVCRAVLAPITAMGGRGGIATRYGVPEDVEDPLTVIEAVAQTRGFILPGGTLDIPRAADAFLRDLRAGRLGRISLERPVREG